MQLAKNDLDNTILRAPVAGVAGNRAGRVGQYVKPGTQLLSLVPLPYVYVTANFKETQLTDMRPGQPVRIRVDAYPDVNFNGHVDSIMHGSGSHFSLLPPENATGNYVKVVQRVPVKIVFDEDVATLQKDGHLLGLGMSAVPTVDMRPGASNATTAK